MERISKTLRTPVCDLLGIKVPILQAGMGWVAYGRLAAAISSAGGLGVIGSGTNMPADEFRREIRLVGSLTDKPFGVNILFAAIKTEDSAAVYTEGVSQMIEVALEERVPVMVSGLGSPKDIIPEAHARGMKVLSVIGAVRYDRKSAAGGVDAVIATGCDGGGHVGKIGTAILIPAVVDVVDVPVVAGGGLADGQGLAAVPALGAQGVWLGTCFIATREPKGHMNYKTKTVDTNESQTVVTRTHSGKPYRLIRNKFTDEWRLVKKISGLTRFNWRSATMRPISGGAKATSRTASCPCLRGKAADSFGMCLRQAMSSDESPEKPPTCSNDLPH